MQILLQTTCKKLKGTARPTKNEQVKRMYGLSTWEIAMHNRFKSILKAHSYLFSSVTSQDIFETHMFDAYLHCPTVLGHVHGSTPFFLEL